MHLDSDSRAAIAHELGLDSKGLRVQPAGGGDIADSYIFQADDARVFVKTISSHHADLLSAEADGLEALAATGTVCVPNVLRRSTLESIAWLALEYFDLKAGNENSDARLGQQLAAMHRHTSIHYGWHRDNFIGLTPQPNHESDDWTEFFLAHRLGHQFELLAGNDPSRNWREIGLVVAQAWRERFNDHCPDASLVHGDLWRGNAARIGPDQPVVFDPVVHYADRECDLAMTELFGGFADDFYRSYEQAWPLPEGYRRRRDFYKLYHLLNHANLFGASYTGAAERLCDRLVKGV